jgi:hypothetical protein
MASGHAGYCHIYDPSRFPETWGEVTTAHTRDFREAQPPEDDDFFPYLSSLYVSKKTITYKIGESRYCKMPNVAPDISKIL